MGITRWVINGRASKQHHFVCECQTCVIEKIAYRKAGGSTMTMGQLERRLKTIEVQIEDLYGKV